MDRQEALARAEANSQEQAFQEAEPGDQFCVRFANGVKLVKVTRITTSRGSRYESSGNRVVWARPYNLSRREWQRTEWRMTSGAGYVSPYEMDHLRKVAEVGEAELAKQLEREARYEARKQKNS